MKARPHLPAYQFLVVQRPSKVLSDQLEALVALGLYFESECKYFASFTAEPTPRELEAFHRVVSAPSALGKLREEATRLVDAHHLFHHRSPAWHRHSRSLSPRLRPGLTSPEFFAAFFPRQKALLATLASAPRPDDISAREVSGGRAPCQPGQVRKEAAAVGQRTGRLLASHHSQTSRSSPSRARGRGLAHAHAG